MAPDQLFEPALPSSLPAQQPFGRAPRRRRRWPLVVALSLIAALLLLLVATRLWLEHTARAALPQIDDTLRSAALAAPVHVLRDHHGVPSIRAASLDDLVIAQGFITAQDRLFQMDTLRRHAAGELAEILGPQLVEHDRVQRVLQIRAAADRALAALPADQRHWLDRYALGVNAAIAVQAGHLPLEFRLLGYTPRPWTPRDSILVGLVMFQDLTTTFPQSLNREAIESALDPSLPPATRDQLLADLYPTGSWRDHPPDQPTVDLTRPVDSIPDIPLDDSQTRLRAPAPSTTPADLLALTTALSPRDCPTCRTGSNNWVVAGSHTASGRPLLSNDMHLTLGVPGLWYQVDLTAPDLASSTGEPFHVAGVSLPGTPFCIVGHNAHVAWGLTNLGAEVQDLTIEHLRGAPGPTEFEDASGVWHPLLHQAETIHVRGRHDLHLDVLASLHGGQATPMLTPLLPSETRAISLRWTAYDPANVTMPFFAINRAHTAAELVNAFATFGGPAQNLVYADDANHIGYHAVGRIPIRGSLDAPAAPHATPTDILADARQSEWVGTIPYDQLPQVADPPFGVLATANARVTPDGYRFPLTLNWPDPYRNERIWKLLGNRTQLTSADMLTIQTDITSESDRLIARRLAYAIDHARDPGRQLRQAADLLRAWDGRVTVDSPAAAITDATRAALWPMLLSPRLRATPHVSATNVTRGARAPVAPWELYTWGERAFAEEQLITHTPARWLPAQYATWNELLTAAVRRGLNDAHAPSNLATWRYGKAHPVDLEHPLFAQFQLLRVLFGPRTGTGERPQSGDGTTIKQVGRSFGPSERFTADLAEPDRTTLNLVLGQSGNPASPWFLDQFPAWLDGTTFPAPFTTAATDAAAEHTLVLEPAAGP